jgi:Holliday junction resolvase
MANRQRQKGDRFERSIVDALNSHALDAQRVPLSGSAGGHYGGDISFAWFDERAKFEAKVRGGADGFKTLYDWLEGNSGLFVKADRKEALVVLRLGDFLDLMRRTHGPDRS